MKRASIFFLIVAGFLFSFQAAHLIPWKENRKLSWDDFKAKPDASSSYKAKTESILNLAIATKGMEASITMQNCFDKNASWVKEKRDILLVHEQAHFDISELWARKFKQRLNGKTFAIKTFQKTLNSMHDSIYKEGKAMQVEYDKETEHSVNTKAQEKWDKKIAADLKSLSAFIPEVVTCKLTK